MVSGRLFLRGTLAPHLRRCGKANTRCAHGELHASLYLVQSHEGKPRPVFVPKEWEERICQSVQGYREIPQLLAGGGADRAAEVREGLAMEEWHEMMLQDFFRRVRKGRSTNSR